MWRERLALYLDLIRFNRPAGWLLLLWPTLSALWIAAGGFPGWHLLSVFALGTILMRSAGCCVNDVMDADFDRHVKRTALRPVTSQRISKREALAVGAVLALLAFLLVLSCNLLTIVYSFAALGLTLLYPLAKRFVSMPQAVLGVAFSFGIPMAFAAAKGEVPLLAWVLLLGNLFWVLAYDTEYAMVDRDDDLQIGMKTSAITLGRFDVLAVLIFYLVYISIWSKIVVEHAGAAIFLIAISLILMQLFWHYQLIKTRSREGCFKAFSQNHWMGMTWVLALAASDVLR